MSCNRVVIIGVSCTSWSYPVPLHCVLSLSSSNLHRPKATVLWASWPIAHFNCEAVWIWKIVVVHGVCCAWLWDRLFGRRGHRREEHEGGGGGGGTRGFDTRAGWSVVCRLCLPLIADTVSMLWTLKDNIWEGEPSAHFLNHGPLASFTCAHGYRHGHLWPMPLPIF